MNQIKHFFGVGPENISTAEKVVSMLGGFISISLIAYISYQFTGAIGAALVAPSMGATAVLLFAVPHGRLSQPWPLFVGNLVSACVGVTCFIIVPNVFLAAGLAVGLAIAFMHILRCIHPPGGATAIAAVIGGPVITDLGYQFVITPILLNVIVIFVIAVVFNSIFPWRRYPVSLMRFTEAPAANLQSASSLLDRKQIEKAIADMDLVVDVTTDDLQRLIALTMEHASKLEMTADQIKMGGFYTNGRHGGEWSVRRIIDEYNSPDPKKDMVIYRVVEGQGLRSSDSCTRQDFARWAVRELFPNSEKTR